MWYHQNTQNRNKIGAALKGDPKEIKIDNCELMKRMEHFGQTSSIRSPAAG